MRAENFERTYKEENIHIGYIVGNHKVVFVKTGQGGSIYGYKNKYLDIALNLNKKYGCSVFVSETITDDRSDFDKEIQFIEWSIMKIELPNYHWFLSKHEGRFVTNTYSGSAGTPCGVGGISTRTFNYKVYADISSGNESQFRLIVESYIIQPWHLGGQKTDFERTEFLCSEDCIAQAEKWLSEVSCKYGF